jgi:predicted Zn-dependent protease with MMP-like domain
MIDVPFSNLRLRYFSREPSLAEFEGIAAEAFRGLPKTFLAPCKDLIIRVEDFATDEVLQRMKIQNKFGLLGLFQGVGLPFRYQSAPMRMPNVIWLYRRPIFNYWRGREDTLEAIITHVLVHEIGHHFGFSDDDMHAIEDSDG